MVVYYERGTPVQSMLLMSQPAPTDSACHPTMETTSGQMAPPKSGHSVRMPPESGGIPGRIHFWEVPSALMLSQSGGCEKFGGVDRGRRGFHYEHVKLLQGAPNPPRLSSD